MRLDGVAVLLVAAGGRTGLNDIGVECALHQELGPLADGPLQLIAVVLEHLNELGPDGLALGLGVCQTTQPVQHDLAVVHTGDRQVQVVGEGVHHALLLLVAQQPVIHKHAVQPLPQHLVDQGGGHCAVHTTRQGADGVILGAHQLSNLAQLLLQHLAHGPVRSHPADVSEEVLDHVHTPLGVHDLGVELEAVDLACGVLNGHNGALVALGHGAEALGQLDGLVTVAHPHIDGLLAEV
mmetsp:Transcript_2785/g.6106  ORF Transcript_2785/g.6106 Transcript_2785/m.6106 type:complete len:238 (+) Transcript_2785:230-943(+)